MTIYILTAKLLYTVNELQIIAVYKSFEAAERAVLELGYEKVGDYYQKSEWLAEIEEWEVEE